MVLLFLLGLAAGLARSELKLPAALYAALSVFLLLAMLGVGRTLIAFAILRALGRLGRADAAATAAHWGSVSVATFAVAVNWLVTREIAL